MTDVGRYAVRSMSFEHLSGERFVSLRTTRRSGEKVATPVWFAERGGTLVVGTFSDSGKVKRLRRAPEAQLAPCNFRGLIKGAWTDVEVEILDGDVDPEIPAALESKYEWQWEMFSRDVDTYLVLRTPD